MSKCKNAIMMQGTGSDVGKSLLVAGVCRAIYNRGVSVCPFKPQNMSNNAGVALHQSGEYGEIGRAQMLQATACHTPPSVHMNPVLLKPQSAKGSQIIIQGTVAGHASAKYFRTLKPKLLGAVMDSFYILSTQYEAIVIEGAGSPAEVNLRSGDIANMGFATTADIAVILVADIDRGGSIAQIVGTHAVLPKSERSRIKGYIINKFRGDISLYNEAIKIIFKHTRWQCFGVVPWFDDAHLLPAEDTMGLDNLCKNIPVLHTHKLFKICVLKTPKIANFDDIDPLRQTPNITVDMVTAPRSIPYDCDAIFIMGSKSTIADMHYIRNMGWDRQIQQHAQNGGFVFGICGGYQMLGSHIADPNGTEGDITKIDGLGLLNMQTVITDTKTVTAVTATHTKTQTDFTGYKIHMGHSTHTHTPFAMMGDTPDGAVDKNIMGTYIHGCFHHDTFRHMILQHMGANSPYFAYGDSLHQVLNDLAQHLNTYLDMDAIWSAGHR